jgi:hypothetical protein
MVSSDVDRSSPILDWNADTLTAPVDLGRSTLDVERRSVLRAPLRLASQGIRSVAELDGRAARYLAAVDR